MKLFPSVLGVLLIYKKRWKEAAFTIVTGLILAIVPFAMLKGGIGSFWFHVSNYIECLKQHALVYQNGSFGLDAATIFGTLSLSSIVGYALLVLSLITAWTFKERWKQFLLLIIAINLASGQQSYYTFLYLLFPLLLFLNKENVLPLGNTA